MNLTKMIFGAAVALQLLLLPNLALSRTYRCDRLLNGTPEYEVPGILPKLEEYVFRNQFYNHTDPRYNGSWSTQIKIREASLPVVGRSRFLEAWPATEETSSFITAKILISLAAESGPKPGRDLEDSFRLGFKQIRDFMDDAVETNEPPGTISYWPLTVVSEHILPYGHLTWFALNPFLYREKKVRYYTNGLYELEAAKSLGFATNIPNDLDSSSQAAVAMMIAAKKFPHLFKKDFRNFLEDYIETIGDVVDRNRRVQHSLEDRWKPRNSGAFLTWVEKARFPDQDKRLPQGLNDVDGIVLLNVLGSIGMYRKEISPELPEKTLRALHDSLYLIRNTIKDGNTANTSRWYERESLFWLGYTKAILFGLEELQTVEDHAKLRVIALSEMLLKQRTFVANELSELLISLKGLYRSRRPQGVKDLISDMEDALLNEINEKNNYASLNGGSAYPVRVNGVVVDWVSRAYSTALAFEALKMK